MTKLGKLCNLTNCLDLHFFLETFSDSADHAGLHRKVGSTPT